MTRDGGGIACPFGADHSIAREGNGEGGLPKQHSHCARDIDKAAQTAFWFFCVAGNRGIEQCYSDGFGINGFALLQLQTHQQRRNTRDYGSCHAASCHAHGFFGAGLRP